MSIAVENIRLLGDQVLVRCLGTANMQGTIHIPMSAQEARKIHQDGEDYLHRGEVLAVGPGDRLVYFWCDNCGTQEQRLVDRLWKTADSVTQVSKVPKCRFCGFGTHTLHDFNHTERTAALTSRAPLGCKVGDVILYERRRDAMLKSTRFPSLGLEDEMLLILHDEQHVLAVLESEAVAV